MLKQLQTIENQQRSLKRFFKEKIGKWRHLVFTDPFQYHHVLRTDVVETFSLRHLFKFSPCMSTLIIGKFLISMCEKTYTGGPRLTRMTGPGENRVR